MKIKQYQKDFFAIVFLALVGSVFFILCGPKDLGDVGLSLFSTDSLIYSAYDNNQNILEYVKENSNGLFGSYNFHMIGHPLTPMILHLFARIFGLSIYNSIILSVIFAFIAVFSAYFIGKYLYSRLYGVVLGIFLAANIYFNVILRTGTVFYTVVIPLILLTLMFFLKAHKTKKTSIRLISIIFSASLFPLCFIGYPQAIIIFPFLFLFLAIVIFNNILIKIRIIKNNQTFLRLPFWYYILFVILVAAFYCGYTLAWEHSIGAKPFSIYQMSVNANKSRYYSSTGTSPLKMDKKEFSARLRKFIDSLFFDIDRDGYFSLQGVHSDTSIPGYPLISYLSSFFLFLGLFYLFRRRHQSDMIIFSFFAVSCAVIFFVFKPYAPRVYIFIVPILLLLSSLGCIQFIKRVVPLRKQAYENVLIVAFVVLINSVNYSVIADDFETNRTGQKIWNAGQTDIINFLKEEKASDDSLVVLAGMTDIYAWIHFIYIDGNIVPTVFYLNEDLNQQDFREWEKEKFKKFKNIYYVFPAEYNVIKSPGRNFGNYGMKRSFSPFLKAHPTLMPVKTVYARSNNPLHYIYKVTEDNYKDTTFVKLKIKPDTKTEIKFNSPTTVKSIYVNGQVSKISFNVDGKSKTIPLNLGDNMDISLVFGGLSLVEFFPDFNTDNPFPNTIKYEYIKKHKAGDRIGVVFGKRSGEIVFKTSFPYNVVRTDIRTNPRMFHDYLKCNKVELYYSKDNIKYLPVYKLVNKGSCRFGIDPEGEKGKSEDWFGHDAHATYDVIFPDSKDIYFKFFLENTFDGDSQLLSFNKTTYFQFFLDTLKVSPLKVNETLEIEFDSEIKEDIEVVLLYK